MSHLLDSKYIKLKKIKKTLCYAAEQTCSFVFIVKNKQKKIYFKQVPKR